MSTTVLLIVVLAGPLATFFGVFAGAFLTHRLMRGQSPLPAIEIRRRSDKNTTAKEPPRMPRVGV